MLKIENFAKSKLDAGEICLGVGLRQARSVDIAPIMKTAGFDWLFIDMEHGAFDIDLASQISVAAQAVGITPIVRVPGYEHFHATRALDGGAQGIVVPHVDDAETAARMVANCRFPPAGHRSVTGVMPQAAFEKHPLSDISAAGNASTLLILMIESPQAVEKVEEIAAVPGIDALLIGTNDLSAEMGIPGQLDHPDIVTAYRRVIAACRQSGIHAGMGGVYTPDLIKVFVDLGMRLVLCGSDLSFMMAGATAQAGAVRRMV